MLILNNKGRCIFLDIHNRYTGLTDKTLQHTMGITEVSQGGTRKWKVAASVLLLSTITFLSLFIYDTIKGTELYISQYDLFICILVIVFCI